MPMCHELAKASITPAVDLPTTWFGAPSPFLKRPAVYGPCTLRIARQYQRPSRHSSVDSRHVLKVRPEQSPPSPWAVGSSGGSHGYESTLSKFQHPPPH